MAERNSKNDKPAENDNTAAIPNYYPCANDHYDNDDSPRDSYFPVIPPNANAATSADGEHGAGLSDPTVFLSESDARYPDAATGPLPDYQLRTSGFVTPSTHGDV